MTQQWSAILPTPVLVPASGRPRGRLRRSRPPRGWLLGAAVCLLAAVARRSCGGGHGGRAFARHPAGPRSQRTLAAAALDSAQAQAPIQVIIFDCDGTLVDTETAYMQAFNKAVSEMYPGPLEDVVQSSESWGRDFVGRGNGSAFAVQSFGLNCTPQEFDSKWTGNFKDMVAAKGSIPLLEGFDQLYRYARVQDIKVAVASSSKGSVLRQKLSNGVLAQSQVVHKLADFDLILSNDNVTSPKPDPEIYHVAARELGVPVEACLVIEDSPPGVQAGKSAGMRVAAVPNQYTRSQDFSHADHVVDTMRAVIDLLSPEAAFVGGVR